MDTQRLWQTVLGELSVDLSTAEVKTFFDGTGILGNENGTLVVAIPSPFTRERIQKRYHQLVLGSVTRTDPTISRIEYAISSKFKQTKRETGPALQPASEPARPRVALGTTAAPQSRASVGVPPVQTQATFRATVTPTINPNYLFDNFVVGPSNELAYASARAVASYPGQKYACLLIYGGVGLGKTHLMQAIGNEILKNDPEARIRYVTSEQFTNEFTDSIQHKKSKRFAEQYRNLDVLIVDDIQFLGNKERTQEEFFHTFNTLHQLGKQIILSSDKAPKAIPNLEDRLRTRFEWGMVADIQRPDLETRSAIIQEKAPNYDLELSIELIDYLARNFQHSVREMEGALTRLSTYCEHAKVQPSVAVMKGLLGAGETTSRRRPTTAKAVLERVAAHFGLRMDELVGTRRDKEIVTPRQIAMYLMYNELGMSYPKIGQSIGGRDHTTAMHSVKKIAALVERDDELRSDINQLREQIAA